MLRLVIVALIVCATSGRKFQNPVSNDNHHGSPGVLLHRGQYYAVSNSVTSDPDKFRIQVSSDLQTWYDAGYALPKNYIPAWSNGKNFFYPEIHEVGDNDFRLVFSAGNNATGQVAIGVGFSTTILGPYIVRSQPFAINATQYLHEPTLVQDGARKYLIWREATQIFGRELSSDCLGFIEGSVEKLVMSSDLPWEEGYVMSPWYVRRPDGWYMFYTGNPEDSWAVGVARAQDPLGPFEKLVDPILVSSFAFKHPGHGSVVSDVFMSTSAMVYQASPPNNSSSIFLMSQSVEWGPEGWPYMKPF